MNKKQKMQENILKHGLLLEKYYRNGSGGGPVTLCKRLRRVENKLHRLFEQYCSEPGITEKQIEQAEKYAHKTVKLLLPNLDMASFEINQDPRGYALKIKPEYTPVDMHRDFGGYGILAPDFS